MTLVDADGNPVIPVDHKIEPRVPTVPVRGFLAEIGTDGVLRWTRNIEPGETFSLTPGELLLLRVLAGGGADV